ncbi:3-deoxy-7-phosphoheptulonate synthase [Streptomyces sp. JJ38]|uniref:3-deoxy-7-phosphoheptulonate synthase n=1 Tax=Streptomyces sp. JJ38 TaxID=2738128 RepID=UPI001C574044|nr:3-deoxy-7-phosphoheptulonate synthase [Streptomyces sp. JJ38]MBW1597389.1 3-deoxy-7-phosphoheptulonate synthase [Streptomyces sp. JJ38]
MTTTESPSQAPSTASSPTPSAAAAAHPFPSPHWRHLPAEQQPEWPDSSSAARVQDRLALWPALTAPADVRRLGSALAQVRAGEAFLLQAGDCAEPVGPAALPAARAKHEAIGTMAELVSDRLDLPTVTVGRLAGQHAKPRSKHAEWVEGRSLPVYRGDMVNGHTPDEASRTPDPWRMHRAYATARAVMNELQLLAHETAGERALRELSGTETTTDFPVRPWDGSLRSVLRGYGQTVRGRQGWTRTGLWTSHEALLLDYEQALVRRDSHTGQPYLLSTHFPWIGDRTRQVGGAHVAFLAGIANPVACKVGPGMREDDLVEICGRIDPHRTPGRLTLISRLGVGHVRERLPELVRAVRRAGHDVVWMCDPMHGNTITLGNGLKTRMISDVLAELTGFFEVLGRAGVWPGGVHLEIAGEEVTECLGAGGCSSEEGLTRAYRTLCDPRLSNAQAYLVTDAVADLLSGL